MRLRAGILAGVLAASIGVATAPSAEADGLNGVDIYSIRATNLVVNSNACRYVPFSVSLTTGVAPGSGYDFHFDADIEAWRGSANVGSTYVYQSSTGQPTVRLSDTYLWCPYTDGLGTLRLGPSHVEFDTYDLDYNDVNSGTYDDHTYGTFIARQASTSSLAVTKVRGRPRLRKFTVGPAYYSVSSSAWVRWKRKTVALQRLSGTRWTTIKWLTSSATTGKAVVKLRASRGQRFRVVVGGTSTTWGGKSVTRVAP